MQVTKLNYYGSDEDKHGLFEFEAETPLGKLAWKETLPRRGESPDGLDFSVVLGGRDIITTDLVDVDFGVPTQAGRNADRFRAQGEQLVLEGLEEWFGRLKDDLLREVMKGEDSVTKKELFSRIRDRFDEFKLGKGQIALELDGSDLELGRNAREACGDVSTEILKLIKKGKTMGSFRLARVVSGMAIAESMFKDEEVYMDHEDELGDMWFEVSPSFRDAGEEFGPNVRIVLQPRGKK